MFSAADRNKDAILDVLREVLPASGTVLEIASGGGQHVMHFSATLPDLHWQPSEADPELVTHLDSLSGPNLLPALHIDVCRPDWPRTVPMKPDAVISANMIHIAPWDACLGLLAGSARLLPPGGLVFLYGPFRVGGGYSSQGNAAFDRALREQNPAWGLRDLEELRDAASAAGFAQDRIVDMPVNNLSAVFRRQTY